MKKLLNNVAKAIVACLCILNLNAKDVNTVNRYIPYPEYTPESQRTPCTPLVTGPIDNCQLTYQASCNGGSPGYLGTFTITNFHPDAMGGWGNYSFNIVPGIFLLTPFNFSAMAPYTFQICFPNNWDHYYVYITDITCPTLPNPTGTTLADVAACCSGLTFLQNPTALMLPNTIGNSPIIATNQIYLIEGTLTINNNLNLVNCSLKMKEGAEIIVEAGYKLEIQTSSIDAACDILWKGITVRNGGILRVLGTGGGTQNTRIRDAQYAVKIEDDAEYLFDSSPNLERNWVGLYFPPLTSGNMHIITSMGGSSDQSFNIVGTQIQGGINPVQLFPDYPGQTPATVNHNSLAAVKLHDVSNFSFFNANSTYQTELGFDQNGIISFNSNIDITKFWIKHMKHVVPPIGTPLVHSYGIFAQGSSAAARQLNIYLGSGFPSFFDGCDTSVFSNQYMNCNLDGVGFNTYFASNSYLRAQRHFYHSGTNRTVTVKNCQFNFADYNLWVNNIQNGTLEIENNYFTAPVPYTQQGTAWTGSYKNSCIIVKGNPNTNALGQVNLKIKNNTFVLMRIGMYLYNIDGVSMNSDQVNTNHFYIYSNVYTPGQLLYHQPHYAYMVERCTNIQFDNNEALNIEPAPPLTYTNYLADAIAFNIKTCGSSVLAGSSMNILSSNIDRMGTSFRFIDNCTDVGLYCNGMNDSHRGVYYDYVNGGAYGSSQGFVDPFGSGGVNRNQWQNWTAPFRIEGTLNSSNGQIGWTYDNANAALEQEHPYNVLPAPQFFDLGITPNVSPNCIVPPPAPNPSQRMANIINDDVEYEVYPDESKERDKLIVYNILKHDVALRNSNIDFINYYNSKVGSNYDKFKEVNTLAASGNYTSAQALLTSIVPDNSLEENMQFALGVGLQIEQNPEYVIPEADKVALTNLAWTTVWEGGEAVFIARSILNLEVNDYGNGLRKAGTDKPNSEIDIFPNPVHDILYINNPNAEKLRAIIRDVTGRTILEKDVNGYLNIGRLSVGVYVLELFNESGKITSEKLIKQ